MIRFLDDAINPLVLIFLKMSKYVKTLKNERNKLSFHQTFKKVFGLKYVKTIWTRIEDLNKILN